MVFDVCDIVLLVGWVLVKVLIVYVIDFWYGGNNFDMLVIGIIEGKIIIDYLIEIVLSVDGDKVFDVFCDLIWIVVVEWYGVNGNIVIGFVKGFGFKWGVIVLIVCYDYYNIVVVGVDYVDMVIVVNCLSEIEGGFVVV